MIEQKLEQLENTGMLDLMLSSYTRFKRINNDMHVNYSRQYVWHRWLVQ